MYDKHQVGLSADYASNERDEYACFEEIPSIEGFPAVASDITDERDSGICALTGCGHGGGDDAADHEGGNMTGSGFFITPHQIYEFITGGPGTRSLGLVEDVVMSEWQAERDRADRIHRVANTLRGGWQGEAGAGAYGAAMPLTEGAVQGVIHLQRSHDLLVRQSESFHRAVNDVRPVPAEPPAGSLDESFPFDVDYDKELTSYQADVQHNIDVFRSYDGASQYNETHMPQEYPNRSMSSGSDVLTAPQVIGDDEYED
jgi:hypothetical protein